VAAGAGSAPAAIPAKQSNLNEPDGGRYCDQGPKGLHEVERLIHDNRVLLPDEATSSLERREIGT
jgi:hypothetical protein